jgi:hypothetical protein
MAGFVRIYGKSIRIPFEGKQISRLNTDELINLASGWKRKGLKAVLVKHLSRK